LKKLSSHYRTYLAEPEMTMFLFQAMMWRHLYHRLFHRVGRCWGQQVHDSFMSLSGSFTASTLVSQREYLLWRLATTKLLHTCHKIDSGVVEDMTVKIYHAIWRFAKGMDYDKLKQALRKIVVIAAELSAAFARSKIIPLLSNRPESTETEGFEFDDKTMAQLGKCSKDGVVDMMISPCLLARDESDEYQLLVKADVIC
jgi:hypothetical protein